MEHGGERGGIAREVGRLVDWPDKVWARRYQSIVVSDEEMAQVERFCEKAYGFAGGSGVLE